MKLAKLAFLPLLTLAATAPAHEPDSHYTIRRIEGWKIHVNNGLLGKGEHAEVGGKALKKLKEDLAAVKTWIPDRPLKELLKAPIWLEVDTTNGPHGSTPVFHYHPDMDWLEEMDFHPGKHKCVEFSRAASYVGRGDRSVQVVLHELAHAYHDRVLGFDKPEILAAYKKAVSGTAYPPGDWARSNEKEFFCAVTQRYFGTKEQRDLLRKRDPDVVKLLKRIWGPPKALKVFVLAGQSNMEGQGVVDLDHPEYYNGGKGILERVMQDPANAQRMAHLKDASGGWVVRDDVWVRFRTAHGFKKGPLTIGFTGYPGKHHIGPELQFGHVIGDALSEQVLLIKTAWGGKSLHKDFRPPSSGGRTGPYYEKMLEEVRGAMEQIAEDSPDYGGGGYEIAGLVWFQGWNDMFDAEARAGYEQNLVNLIKDVRRAWDRPNLPVVIGELGNGGPDASPNMLAIRRAQAAAAARPEFQRKVAFVKTSSFARPREQSPNVGHGHHWFGNAESYYLIGDGMGKAMVKLLGGPRAPATPKPPSTKK